MAKPFKDLTVNERIEFSVKMQLAAIQQYEGPKAAEDWLYSKDRQEFEHKIRQTMEKI